MEAEDSVRHGEIAAAVDGIFAIFESRRWERMAPYLGEEIDFDHTSAVGGRPLRLTRAELIEKWRSSLHPGKRNFHLLGRYEVEAEDTEATASFNCYAAGKLDPALGGGLYEVWGRHTLGFRLTGQGWRAVSFTFDVFHWRGDAEVNTHTLAAPECSGRPVGRKGAVV